MREFEAADGASNAKGELLRHRLPARAIVAERVEKGSDVSASQLIRKGAILGEGYME
jgi:hypothetical protein